MKKKIERLLAKGSLKNNAESKPLYADYQSAKTARELAKQQKNDAKEAYRNALSTIKKSDVQLLELLTTLRQSKSMLDYHSAGLHLATRRLHDWVEAFLKSTPKPAAKKQTEKARPPKKEALVNVSTPKKANASAK